ncbi:DNA-binding protein [Mycobacteroides abscessus]|uniref:helix-turn-helix transcriptional regulator n=1 Tax=Mycobacteroides abscessus TaxID=36809 RepID=UPI000E67F5D6|nr:helix-turn-helix domain-containing protein [Mycobacteroides abscessus]RIT84228.1 DNA-binding protein [Mycobacteroides abscessus]
MNEVMTAKELAAELHMTEAALAQDRYRGTGIPFVKVGGRRVRYLRADVMAYLASNRMQRTDGQGVA